MNDQPAETTPPPPWTVTGAFQCQTCGTPYRSALAALNCCPMLPSPWTVWDCGQEHPQGRLHASEEDAEACIARNRKGGTDGDPVTPWKTGKGYLCPSCAALCRSESEASECCTIEEWPETWTCGQPPEICGNRSIHRTEVEARECIASGGHR